VVNDEETTDGFGGPCAKFLRVDVLVSAWPSILASENGKEDGSYFGKEIKKSKKKRV
jgi:hypothetical protein